MLSQIPALRLYSEEPGQLIHQADCPESLVSKHILLNLVPIAKKPLFGSRIGFHRLRQDGPQTAKSRTRRLIRCNQVYPKPGPSYIEYTCIRMVVKTRYKMAIGINGYYMSFCGIVSSQERQEWGLWLCCADLTIELLPTASTALKALRDKKGDVFLLTVAQARWRSSRILLGAQSPQNLGGV